MLRTSSFRRFDRSLNRSIPIFSFYVSYIFSSVFFLAILILILYIYFGLIEVNDFDFMLPWSLTSSVFCGVVAKGAGVTGNRWIRYILFFCNIKEKKWYVPNFSEFLHANAVPDV